MVLVCIAKYLLLYLHCLLLGQLCGTYSVASPKRTMVEEEVVDYEDDLKDEVAAKTNGSNSDVG